MCSLYQVNDAVDLWDHFRPWQYRRTFTVMCLQRHVLEIQVFVKFMQKAYYQKKTCTDLKFFVFLHQNELSFFMFQGLT